jgi:hypothetical protein
VVWGRDLTRFGGVKMTREFSQREPRKELSDSGTRSMFLKLRGTEAWSCSCLGVDGAELEG